MKFKEEREENREDENKPKSRLDIEEFLAQVGEWPIFFLRLNGYRKASIKRLGVYLPFSSRT